MSNFKSIIMKSRISMLLFVATFAVACTNEMEEFAKDSFKNVPENASLTRSCSGDTIDLGELVSLEETEEQKDLKARYEKMYSSNRKVQALDAIVDDFFSSNIYAILQLQILTFSVMEQEKRLHWEIHRHHPEVVFILKFFRQHLVFHI